MKKIIFITIGIFVFFACGEKFEVIEDFGKEKYKLINQNGAEVIFPDLTKGKTAIVGYIFTNCPDICPLTTNNMRLIQERLKKEKVEGVNFVSISFDPENDKPDVLKKFAEIRNLDLSNWTFLTGQKLVIDSVIKKAGVVAVPGDSTIYPDGRKIYYFVHTDRIQLVDDEGRVRKNYPGSKINVDEIVGDIKSLVD
ncbi:MAG: SCO family protein [Ignavibacteriales bacterium]|nr:SCO family protein [Ignavibacteriales bacterium]